MATYLAAQRMRTREQRVQQDFFDRALKAINRRPVAHEDMIEFLRDQWGSVNPSTGEARAACDLINGMLNMQRGNEVVPRIDTFAIPGLVQNVTDQLLNASWRIERCHAANLLTSDTPVTLWRPRSERDAVEGLAVSSADEVWFPIDPRHLLVISPKSSKRGFWDVRQSRFDAVNRELASRCFEVVVGTLNQGEYLEALPMTLKRPALRFAEGPLFERGWDGGSVYRGDVVQMWVPAHDQV